MGAHPYRLGVAALAAVLTVSGVVPLHAAGDLESDTVWAQGPVAPATSAAATSSAAEPEYLEPSDLPVRQYDGEAQVSVVPPRGWQLSPVTSLERTGDEDSYEVVRYQMSVHDPALYAQPLPITSGLLADAGAILSLSLAREGGALIGADLELLDAGAVHRAAGVSFVDGETSYDGVVTFTRIIVVRDSDRTLIVRAFVPAEQRASLGPIVLAAIASATLDPDGPNGPRYVAPAPPAPPAAPEVTAATAQSEPDPSSQVRAEIVARAALMLGTPYVWGGNSAGRAMDCSAYVSAAWGVARYTTDSIGYVATGIAKADLLPGDALNLETWRDPSRYGHIRLFDAWANEAHTLVWVYEETPPRAIHRVIAYDPSYRPIRLVGLSGDGVAPLIAAPAPMPVPRLGGTQPAATRRPIATVRPTFRPPTRTPVPTPRPTVRATPTPTPRPTVRPTPTPTPRPTATARSTVQPPTATPRPTATPTRR